MLIILMENIGKNGNFVLMATDQYIYIYIVKNHYRV